MITMKECREAGYCARGVREFCKANGIDYQRFLSEGIPFDEVRHIDDQMLKDLMEARGGWQ